MFTRFNSCAVKVAEQFLLEYLIYEGTLSRTRYTRYNSKDSKRNLDIYILQIVLTCTLYFHPSSRSSTFRWNRDYFLSTQILTGDGILIFDKVLHLTNSDNLAAVNSGSRPYINYVVRRPHRIFIMLDYYKSIAKTLKSLE